MWAGVRPEAVMTVSHTCGIVMQLRSAHCMLCLEIEITGTTFFVCTNCLVRLSVRADVWEAV